MPKTTSQGTCHLCQGTFSKATMSRHLAKCIPAHLADQPPSDEAASTKAKLFHLVVQGKDASVYWLHVDIPATAALADLDQFLRHIWLECCGHLSAFTIQGTIYSVMSHDGMADQDMNVRVGELFRPGLAFTHEYDFGSTTMLTLKVVSEREGPVAKQQAVRLLARNAPPLIPCASCGQPATGIVMEEAWTPDGWQCAQCLKKHDYHEEQVLPVVNSPRTGVCGYTGP
ncbi:MAG TPA: hypothetical protein VG013_38840 [Gemmataceae bacterium]|jgi:hypothetical protein|nr:hypothetical protein [Gemmataceae bacterium]